MDEELKEVWKFIGWGLLWSGVIGCITIFFMWVYMPLPIFQSGSQEDNLKLLWSLTLVSTFVSFGFLLLVGTTLLSYVKKVDLEIDKLLDYFGI